jgi:hypothetical protein
MVRARSASQFAENTLPVIRQIQAAGVKTLRKIAAALNARGIRTPRGGEWQAETVGRVMDGAA